MARELGKLPYPQLFDTALEEAEALETLQRGDASAAGFAAAAAQRAAATAATVNGARRCRKCEACVNNSGSVRRRCLLVRAYAAASAGHVGARLAAAPSLASTRHALASTSPSTARSVQARRWR